MFPDKRLTLPGEIINPRRKSIHMGCASSEETATNENAAPAAEPGDDVVEPPVPDDIEDGIALGNSVLKEKKKGKRVKKVKKKRAKGLESETSSPDDGGALADGDANAKTAKRIRRRKAPPENPLAEAAAAEEPDSRGSSEPSSPRGRLRRQINNTSFGRRVESRGDSGEASLHGSPRASPLPTRRGVSPRPSVSFKE